MSEIQHDLQDVQQVLIGCMSHSDCINRLHLLSCQVSEQVFVVAVIFTGVISQTEANSRHKDLRREFLPHAPTQRAFRFILFIANFNSGDVHLCLDLLHCSSDRNTTLLYCDGFWPEHTPRLQKVPKLPSFLDLWRSCRNWSCQQSFGLPTV